MEDEAIIGGDQRLIAEPNGIIVIEIRHHADRAHAAAAGYHHGHERGLAAGAGEMEPLGITLSHQSPYTMFVIRGFAQRADTDERDVVENILWQMLHTPLV